jgi:Co/Zn/Cd efflux system component
MTEDTLTDDAQPNSGQRTVALRRVARWVLVLNLAYFGVEFTVARAIGSVSLFADSIDFLEDAAVNMLIIIALGWRRERRAAVGLLLAAVLLVPGFATAWTAWQKFSFLVPPAALPLSVTGLGALATNFSCALMLARVRHAGGSLSRAAFLSARNDVLANVAIVAAGGITLLWHSAWPDLLVGLGIFAINLDAAREVYVAARQEGQSPQPTARRQAIHPCRRANSRTA